MKKIKWDISVVLSGSSIEHFVEENQSREDAIIQVINRLKPKANSKILKVFSKPLE